MNSKLNRFGTSLLVVGILGSFVSPQTAALAQSGNSKSPFARGCELMMQKNFSGAISSFTEAIADDGEDVNSYFRRGQSFLCIGNYKEAIVDFDRALAKGALDYNVYLWKGTANAKLNNVEQAVFNYEKAMRLNPKLVEPFRGTDGKKPEEAQSANPNDKSNSAAVAAVTPAAPAAAVTPASSTSGGLEARVAAVQAAVNSMMASQHGASVDARTSSSSAADSGIKTKSATLSLGRNERAVDAYKTAARNIIDNESGYFRPGTTYSGLLNISGQLIPLSGFNGQPEWADRVQHGTRYFSLKDPERDIRDLDAQIVARPQDPTLLFERARASIQLGNQKQTLEDLNRAIELDGTNPNYFLARAFYYHQLKDLDSAEEDIRRAQDIDPIVPSDLKFEAPAKAKQESNSTKLSSPLLEHAQDK
ncbi:MAG: tetratricopeptide repeat protein [Candidatus Obscuribacterales bacterium]